MFLRQLDLSTALRPSLFDDEVLLHVSFSCGLSVFGWKGKWLSAGITHLAVAGRFAIDIILCINRFKMALDFTRVRRLPSYMA